MESLAKLLFDFDKLPSKLVLIVLILSGVLLFVPPEILANVRLAQFNNTYGQWVGLSFLVSASFLGVTLITTLRNYIGKRNSYKEREKSIVNNLQRLDPLEQSVLREFFLVSMTNNLPMDDAIVAGLQDKGIIRLVQTNIGGYFMNGSELPCTLTDFAREVIMKNPQYIALPLDSRNISEEQKNWLRKNRPSWTGDIYDDF